MLKYAFICWFLLVSLATAQVLDWTPDDFLTKSKQYAYVLANFQNPSCQYCKALEKEFEAAAAEIFADYPQVAVVNANCIENPEFLSRYGITGYPTLKWFNTKNNMETDQGETYASARSASALVEFVKQKLSASTKSQSSRSVKEQVLGEVVTLTPRTFNEEVFDSKKYAFVEFFAPWCGYCKKVRPVVANLAKAFAGESGVLIAEVDASAHVDLGTKYNVGGYPTFKLFIPGLEDPVDYNGDRDLPSFIRFINEHAKTNVDENTTPDLNIGVIPSLETYVKKFMEDPEKAAILKKNENEIQNVPGESTKYYLEIMKLIVSEGVGFVGKEIKRLQVLLKDSSSLTRSKFVLFTTRSNILKVFQKYIGDAGHVEL